MTVEAVPAHAGLYTDKKPGRSAPRFTGRPPSDKKLKQLKIADTYADSSDAARLREAVIPGRTRALFIEAPADPLMKITARGAPKTRDYRGTDSPLGRVGRCAVI